MIKMCGNSESVAEKLCPIVCLARFYLTNFKQGVERDLKKRGIAYEDAEEVLLNIIVCTIFAFTNTIVRNTMGKLGVAIIEEEMESLCQKLTRQNEAACKEKIRESNGGVVSEEDRKAENKEVRSSAPWIMFQ